ncbi:GGDEF domain-containing protein [Nostocaceae cyanobacterium CENA357]|uniref:GGDEF domain-containing protein n=1 Tax=Atlanticothrix silvestris CENA357 TaxID=1725252 RepID=A0A8J7L0F9_9CYAN|nr:GGDEF domain-containing protein [Atlanticothrix silvestris]MBH8553250.1 GGDEF domain-containing protein [Atlanticothrix silvestris CENA357]
MYLIKKLDAKPKSFSILLSICLTGIMGLIDHYIPSDMSVSILYLFPVGIATWIGGNYTGLLISIISSIIWLIVNPKPLSCSSAFFVPYWNTVVNLAFFLFTNYLLSELKYTLKNLEKLARTDALTGLINRMFFLELAKREINQALRHQESLTLAYIDIDDFKKVNDQFGHGVGDRLLCLVADVAQNTLRKIDIVARIGGDEFAILLPRTSYESAEVVLYRVQKVLVASMKQQGFSVTFSIGAITFSDPPESVTEMIEKADHLMYFAKKKGKNLLQHELAVTLQDVT